MSGEERCRRVGVSGSLRGRSKEMPLPEGRMAIEVPRNKEISGGENEEISGGGRNGR